MSSGESGGNLRHVVVLLVVLAAAGLSAWLLWRVADAASDISARSGAIAESARPINEYTEAVQQLDRTNDLARSILESARPLDERLAAIVELTTEIAGSARSINASARRIDAVAGEINGTVRAINETAGAIDSTAAAIDATAGGIMAKVDGILTIARRIDTDVRLINTNLDDSVRRAQLIKLDTSDIVIEARAGHQTTACIDDKVPDADQDGGDRHCQTMQEWEERAERRDDGNR